ncbi:Gfo/Idh/MocA family protein [Sediminimonas qiaohouensis]|uniref:Gfo/Idh/MocA family protein n=1 Tax=Sediminimonas qiaohouensis TaxID=552061 RepID=UPI00041B452E|nr:Gfo/Idh/MocA family oxidoreductase [Sediminimonas qiaohouensis]
MSEELDFILSGPGLIGKKHAALIDAHPDARLSAVVAPDRPQNRGFSDTHGVPLFQDLDSALDAVDCGAAIVSSPNEFHYDQAMCCVERNIPVLIEKPLTDQLRTAAALADAAEARSVPVLVGHHRTYSPLLEIAQNFLKSEAFGNPVAVQGSALFYKPEDYFLAGPWRTRAGGGPILINMIHEIGILRFLFGEIESVTARVSSAARGFEVEDTAAVTFAFSNGAVGTFLISDASASSKSWEMTAGENPAYPFFPEENCYHFAGMMGSLDFPSMRFRTYSGRSERTWWAAFEEGRLAIEREDPLETQLTHFIDVIRGATPPRVSARDGYQNMVVLEAIVEAGRSGHEVRTDEIGT